MTKPEVGYPRWRTQNFKYVYHSLYTRQQQNFDSYTYVFGIQLYNGIGDNVARPNGKKPEVENPRWWHINLKYMYPSLCTR